MTVNQDQIELGDSQSGKYKFRVYVGEAMFEEIYVYAANARQARRIAEQARYYVRRVVIVS